MDSTLLDIKLCKKFNGPGRGKVIKRDQLVKELGQDNSGSIDAWLRDKVKSGELRLHGGGDYSMVVDNLKDKGDKILDTLGDVSHIKI